jgi:hypothetical protein
MEDRSMARGSAIATFVADAYISNSRITYHSKPFPIRSSMYLNKNNINKMNMTMKKVTIKGFKKALNTNKCTFFTGIKIEKIYLYAPNTLIKY